MTLDRSHLKHENDQIMQNFQEEIMSKFQLFIISYKKTLQKN